MNLKKINNDYVKKLVITSIATTMLSHSAPIYTFANEKSKENIKVEENNQISTDNKSKNEQVSNKDTIKIDESSELNNKNTNVDENSTSNLEIISSNEELEENKIQEITDNLTTEKNTENESKKITEEKVKQNEKTKATNNLRTDEIVNIPDQNLKKALNKELRQSENSNITKKQLETITHLIANIENISNLEGLQYCSNLTDLGLSYNQISDISPLKNLTKLTSLHLSNNELIDISPLKNLTNLTSLNLSSNQIGDISPLKNLTKLTTLYLDNNSISDISPLKNLTKLTTLYLHNNSISDVSPLINLTNLTSLSLFINQISDISPLKNLTNLTDLTLNDNQISDISPLKTLKNLTILELGWQSITAKPIQSINGSAETDNIIKGINNEFIAPTNIIPNGVYDKNSNKIKWTNLYKTDKVTYWFNHKVTIGKSNGTFSGHVSMNVIYETNEKPVIHAENKTIKVGSKFNLMDGVTATDKEDGNITNKIKVVESTVSLSKPGTYKVVYEVTDSQGSKTRKTITVTVVSNDKSVINGTDNVTIKEGTSFNPMDGVTATDKEDGNITNKVKVEGKVDTSKTGNYELTYTVTDTDGNTTTVKRVVTVIANTENINEKPVIHAENKTIKVGNKFDLMEGVTATDKEDGNITNKVKIVKNTIDINKPGTYEITYKVTDKNGSVTEKTIKVTVVNSEIDNSTSTGSKPSGNSNNIVGNNETTTNTPSNSQQINQVTSNSSSNPKTGDTSILGFFGLGVASLVGLVSNRKKEK